MDGFECESEIISVVFLFGLLRESSSSVQQPHHHLPHFFFPQCSIPFNFIQIAFCGIPSIFRLVRNFLAFPPGGNPYQTTAESEEEVPPGKALVANLHFIVGKGRVVPMTRVASPPLFLHATRAQDSFFYQPPLPPHSSVFASFDRKSSPLLFNTFLPPSTPWTWTINLNQIKGVWNKDRNQPN